MQPDHFFDNVDLSTIPREHHWIMIGANSGKIYQSAVSKPMVYRTMFERFPNFTTQTNTTHTQRAVKDVYPEPMTIREIIIKNGRRYIK